MRVSFKKFESTLGSNRRNKTVFTIVHFDINVLGPMILNHCKPIMEESGITVFHKHFHSTYDLTIVSKIATPLMEFE